MDGSRRMGLWDVMEQLAEFFIDRGVPGVLRAGHDLALGSRSSQFARGPCKRTPAVVPVGEERRSPR